MSGVNRVEAALFSALCHELAHVVETDLAAPGRVDLVEIVVDEAQARAPGFFAREAAAGIEIGFLEALLSLSSASLRKAWPEAGVVGGGERSADGRKGPCWLAGTWAQALSESSANAAKLPRVRKLRVI
ncbi:hypothetical protein LP420_36660 [Massilia sp. B-10]|nr:hypothetical protein LP420_36660 [Massilia sp. B-10]